jgi:hypothetical protein
MEVRVELDNTDAIFYDPLPNEAEDAVSHVCSYLVKGARFSAAFQRRQ